MSRLLVFDLDGTLIDSRSDIANALNYALEERGFARLSTQAIARLVGRGAEALVRDAAPGAAAEEIQAVFKIFIARYNDHLLDETSLYPGALDFLESCHSWEKALVTNKPDLLTQQIVQQLQLKSYFRWIIGGDTLAVQKPHPDVLNPIRAELKNWESSAIIGDSTVDIACGRATGMTTCILTHGFGERDDLVEARPDFLVDDFAELKALELFA